MRRVATTVLGALLLVSLASAQVIERSATSVAYQETPPEWLSELQQALSTPILSGKLLENTAACTLCVDEQGECDLPGGFPPATRCCRPGLTCQIAQCGNPKCLPSAAKIPLGQVCKPDTDVCEEGECRPNGINFSCLKYVLPETCSCATGTDTCSSGSITQQTLFCPSGKCGATSLKGQVCHVDSDCKGNSKAISEGFAPELVCRKRCTIKKPVGQLCVLNSECQSGRCFENKCIGENRGALQATCRINGDCDSLCCSDDGKCAANNVIIPSPEGGPCACNLACAPGLVCDRGSCRTVKETGQPCCSSSQCKSFNCQGGRCVGNGVYKGYNDACSRTSLTDRCAHPLICVSRGGKSQRCRKVVEGPGEPCSQNGDCSTKYCADGICSDKAAVKKPANTECTLDSECEGFCKATVDKTTGKTTRACATSFPAGQECSRDVMCGSRFCFDGKCWAAGVTDDICDSESDCESGGCASVCVESPKGLTGAFCTDPSQCHSGLCKKMKCAAKEDVGDICTTKSYTAPPKPPRSRHKVCDTQRCIKQCTDRSNLLEDCEIDDHCQSGVCRNGLCISKLPAGADCNTHNECISEYCNREGLCEDRRGDGLPCSDVGSEGCINICVNLPGLEPTCGGSLNSNCTRSDHCLSNFCDLGEIRQPTGNCSLGREMYQVSKGRRGDDCRSNIVVNGLCMPAKATRGQGCDPSSETGQYSECIPGHYCRRDYSGNHCEPWLQVGETCRFDLECEITRCFNTTCHPCTSTSQCRSDTERCVDGACVPLANKEERCSALGQGECRDPFTCAFACARPARVNDTCDTSEECGDGVCKGGVCAFKLPDGEPCQTDLSCESEQCQRQCSAPDRPNGERCECEGDLCPGGPCAGGLCSNRTCTSQAVLGSPCREHFQCDTGFCQSGTCAVNTAGVTLICNLLSKSHLECPSDMYCKEKESTTLRHLLQTSPTAAPAASPTAAASDPGSTAASPAPAASASATPTPTATPTPAPTVAPTIGECAPRLADGSPCTLASSAQCASGRCVASVCSGGPGSECGRGSECTSGICLDQVCQEPVDQGRACLDDGSCKSGYCKRGCLARLPDGERCEADVNCMSTKCLFGKCAPEKNCLDYLCPSGQVCDTFGTQKCVDLKKLGDPCNPGEKSAIQCPFGSRCVVAPQVSGRLLETDSAALRSLLGVPAYLIAQTNGSSPTPAATTTPTPSSSPAPVEPGSGLEGVCVQERTVAIAQSCAVQYSSLDPRRAPGASEFVEPVDVMCDDQVQDADMNGVWCDPQTQRCALKVVQKCGDAPTPTPSTPTPTATPTPTPTGNSSVSPTASATATPTPTATPNPGTGNPDDISTYTCSGTVSCAPVSAFKPAGNDTLETAYNITARAAFDICRASFGCHNAFPDFEGLNCLAQNCNEEFFNYYCSIGLIKNNPEHPAISCANRRLCDPNDCCDATSTCSSCTVRSTAFGSCPITCDKPRAKSETECRCTCRDALASGIACDKRRMMLVLRGSVDSFNEHRFLYELASRLDVKSNDILIKGITRGSVRLELEIAKAEIAEKLLEETEAPASTFNTEFNVIAASAGDIERCEFVSCPTGQTCISGQCTTTKEAKEASEKAWLDQYPEDKKTNIPWMYIGIGVGGAILMVVIGWLTCKCKGRGGGGGKFKAGGGGGEDDFKFNARSSNALYSGNDNL